MSVQDTQVHTSHVTISSSRLYSWSKTLLIYHGMSESHAAMISSHLIDSNERGIDSHGIMRLPVYIARITQGLVDPQKIPHVKKKRHSVIVDGKGTNGQVVATYATDALSSLAKKKKTMVCAVAKNSTHFGCAGYYARVLAAQGNIACVMTNSESCVAPYGGNEAILGTNPIALAVPMRDEPLVFDFSTSITSFGEVFISREKGESVPRHWGFDEHGNVTDDPSVITALRPMGEYKGYGLGLFVDILCGVLTGASFGTQIGNMYKDFSKPQNVGHFMWALPIDSIMDLSRFKARMDDFLAMVRESRPEHDGTSVRIPGDKSRAIKRERSATGIPIDEKLWKMLQILAHDANIPLNG